MKTTLTPLTRLKRFTLYRRRTLVQSGFSLIEVLISIVILSFGLLGMVGLQASAIQSNKDARLQSTAGGLARELAEMMRSNMVVALGTTAATNPFLADITSSGTPPAMAHSNPSYCLNASNTATACADNIEVARAQMTEWLARANTDLPGARVVVCVDSAPFDASGLPQWGCTAGTNATFVVKLGWTRGSTDRSKKGADALERAVVPSIVYPVTPGNS
jgi:type IV pilus assembly protein PilV